MFNRLGILYAEESGKGITHPFFAPILNAINDEAAAHGYDTVFINRLDHCHGIDGLCLVCVNFSSPEIKALISGDLPCVTIDHIFKGAPSVLSDNETGVQKLVEYAIERGHRRIAFVHGHNNSTVTRARIHQFLNTMDYYKFPVPAEYLCEGRYDDVVLTQDIVARLLSLPTPPTCILLPDDIAYLGAQEAARELHLEIPADVSFAGYDGIALIQELSPQLTTIRQDCKTIGQTAARTLINLIEDPKSVRRMPLILPVEFIAGETVAVLSGAEQ